MYISLFVSYYVYRERKPVVVVLDCVTKIFSFKRLYILPKLFERRRKLTRTSEMNSLSIFSPFDKYIKLSTLNGLCVLDKKYWLHIYSFYIQTKFS